MNAIVRWSLTSVAVVGLAIDAYTHLDLAHDFAFNKTRTVSEATLFRIEAALAIAAAVLLIVWARWWSSAFALAVAGGGMALLLLYGYVNVGQLGPFPNMYDPVWYAEKGWSVAGEAMAVAASAALLGLQLMGRIRRPGPTRHRVATLAG